MDRVAGMGLAISEAQATLLFKYLGMVEAKNREFNLTAIADWGEAVERHLLESLVGWQVWARLEKECGVGYKWEKIQLVDVGTGAGFPGMVMAMAPPGGMQVKAALVEATRKKVEFLEAAIRELGVPGVRAFWCRAEEMGRKREHREQYHLALSRAVASVAVLAEYCLPLVQVGGWALWWKGPRVEEEELPRGMPAIEAMGGRVRAVVRLMVPKVKKEGEPGRVGASEGGGRDLSGSEPGEEEARQLSWVVVEKVAPTPARFPRRPGIPAKRPWGGQEGRRCIHC